MIQNNINNKDARVLIASEEASSSADIKFDNVFEDGFAAYEVIWSKIIPATDATSLRFVLRTATPADDTSTNRWGSQYIGVDVAGSGFQTNQNATTHVQMRHGSGTASNEEQNGHVFIHNPQSTAWKYMPWRDSVNNSSANEYTTTGGAFNSSTSAMYGIRFWMSTGNIASGTFKLYGWRNKR